jgi:hypothetical protein
MALAFFLGLASSVLVYIAWGSYKRRRRQATQEEVKERAGHEFESGHKSGNNPIAPFLIFIYTGVIVWTLAYVFFIYYRNKAIW